MFGSLGFTEIAFILILALLLFGPKRLPEIGRTIGKGMAEFRKASNDLRRTLETEVADVEREERRAQVPARLASAPSTAEPRVAADGLTLASLAPPAPGDSLALDEPVGPVEPGAPAATAPGSDPPTPSRPEPDVQG